MKVKLLLTLCLAALVLCSCGPQSGATDDLYLVRLPDNWQEQAATVEQDLVIPTVSPQDGTEQSRRA